MFMKKPKTITAEIQFSEIKAGDLITAVSVHHGVRYSQTGVAFEMFKTPQGDGEWRTSQGGTITVEDDEDTIYRMRVQA